MHFCSHLRRLLSVRGLCSWNLRGIGSFQKHRSSSNIWGESTDELENSEIFNSSCFPGLKERQNTPKFCQAQMNHQQFRVYFAPKSTTLSCSFKLSKYFRTAKIRVDFSWNSCLKFLKVISISGHINNLI